MASGSATHLVSDLFYSYEEDFSRLIVNAERKLESSDTSDDPKVQLTNLTSCGKLLNQAEQCLKQLELEARTLPVGVGVDVLPRVSDHRKRLDSLSRDVRTKKMEAQRNALIQDGVSASAIDGRERARKLEQQVADGTRQVEESTRVALETETVGYSVLEELRSQRETVDRSRANVRSMGSNLDEARRRINSMGCSLWGVCSDGARSLMGSLR
eukprot:GHVR01166383.1.p1 GENE.GHVR01166383.1~~GHVR01166383.1.p1  ORF type:complete len:213 (+),score=49.23 GHVR01166383.1:58-696(+)